MFKFSLLFIFIFYCSVCFSQSDSTVYFLTSPELSYSAKGSVLSFPQPIKMNAYAEKMADSSVEIRQIVADFRLEVYSKFFTHKINSDSLKKLMTSYIIDTASLMKWEGQEIINILIKRLPNDYYQVIADVNHNSTFQDDKIFTTKGDEKCYIEYEAFFYIEQNKYIKRLLIVVEPNNAKMPVLPGYEKKFRTVAGVKNVVQGKIEMGGNYYWLNLTSKNKQLYFGQKDLLFSIGAKNEANVDFFASNTILYTEDDTISIGNHLMKYKKTSLNGDTVYFHYYGINKMEQGPNVGQKIKSIEGKDFATGLYKEIIFQYASKQYTVIHFWGSWCTPCIEKLPKIRDLFERKFNSVRFIGLPYESIGDLPKAKQIIKNYKLEWLQIIQLRDDPFYRADMVRDLKVGTFPTYILVDSNGVILVRNSNFSEIEKYFDK